MAKSARFVKSNQRLTRETGALLLEVCKLKELEAVERIALPMVCFAGRRLAVLATPPSVLARKWT